MKVRVASDQNNLNLLSRELFTVFQIRIYVSRRKSCHLPAAVLCGTFLKNFKKTIKGNATCNLCDKNYKTSGNTSNLTTHLRIKHYHAFSEFKNAAGGKSFLDSEPDSEPKTKKSALDRQRRLPFTTSSPMPSTSSSLGLSHHEVEAENVADSDLSEANPKNYDVSLTTRLK